MSYLNVENSDYKLNKYAQITPKIIPKKKVFFPETEKHPQDSVKKKEMKNHIIDIKNVTNNRTLINSLSQTHLKTIKNQISSIRNLSVEKIYKKPILEPRPRNNKSKKRKRLVSVKTYGPSPKNAEVNEINNILSLNLKEFEFKEQIGKGTFGNIFSVKWKKNNEFYAMKKETLFDFEDIKNRINKGLPTLAECGGFMYLMDRIVDRDNNSFSMVGLIPGEAMWQGKLSRFGYARFENDRFSIKGHEFHYFDTDNNGDDFTAIKPSGQTFKCIHKIGSVIAGFPHLYYPSAPDFARRFIEEAANYEV